VLRNRSEIGLAVVTLALCLGAASHARAADTFAWTPAGDPAVARGREVARRFDLLNLTEVTVEVDNAFSAANREALATAEQRLAEAPGIRRVFGPARLLELTVDGTGKASARPVLSRGTSESDGEAARQRVVRRPDALGWYLSADGRLVRFLIDTGDFAHVRGAVGAALAASGLGLVQPPVGDGLAARALWPDPRTRGARWLPAALVAAWVLFIVIAGFKARPLTGRFSRVGAFGVLAASALGAGALFVTVPVAGVRLVGAAAAGVAAAMVLLGLVLERRRGPRSGGWYRFPRPPWPVVLLALAPLCAFGLLIPRLRVGTHQWSEAPLLFVSVRADLDQPVVLREVQRLTDFLRAQPGVANAWSVADLFMGVETAGEEASRIPPDADDVRQVLVQARMDPAVALELSADHREALIGIRFEDEDPTDRLDLVDRLTLYLVAELRSWLLRVDLRGPELPAPARGVARGLLASDTRERVLRICARSGRPLSAAEALSVERVARQAAAIPTADPARLKTEIADDMRDFVGRYPVPLHVSEQARLVDELAALPDDASAGEVGAIVTLMYGERLSERVLADTAEILWNRMRAVHWRHTARINFHEMLYGAELPTEGVLADEVRGATLEGMGPVVGIPVAPGSSAALRIDAAVVGGAAHDRALSEAFTDGLRGNLAVVVAALGVLLLLVGGISGLGWLPLAFAPVAAAAITPAFLREPIGLWSLSFFAGALAAGALIAAAFAARRRP
jgi:hypothetical protein